MKSSPKVSVVTISYNQEKYIGEALQSFVEQQTDFDFEVIVADDCSSDKTPEIIADYAKKYPKIIKPNFRIKNVGAVKNFMDTMKAAKGEYIALCEGDDFWTDPTKLQRQADFLDKHPDYTVCFHPVRVFFEGDVQEEFIFPDEKNKPKAFTIQALLERNFIQTNSAMYRTQNYDAVPEDILPLDWYLHLYHAQFGKIGFIDRVMGAYRRHPGGLWWDSYAGVHKIWQKYGNAHMALYVAILKLYGDNPKLKPIIEQHIVGLLDTLRQVDKEYNEKLLGKALEFFPAGAEMYVNHVLKGMKALDEHSKEQAKIIQHYIDLSKNIEAERQGYAVEIERLADENRKLNARLLIRLEGAVKRRVKGIKRIHR